MTLFPTSLLRRRGGTVGTTFKALSASAAVFLFSGTVLLAPRAPAQTLVLDNVPYGTVMWSDADPFGFAALAGVTNMAASEPASHVALSNYVNAASAAGSNNVSTLSGTVTALSGGVTASNALFNAWIAGLLSESNNWTTAFSWGNWADPVASNTAAIAALQTNTLTRADGLAYVTKEAFSTNRVTRWYDPEDPNRFGQLEGGTNIVIYKAEVSGTNFVVTLSADFLDTGTQTRPAWTNSVFPFYDGDWYGVVNPSVDFVIGNFAGSGDWSAQFSEVYPVVLSPNNETAQGTATVSLAGYTYTTNVEWRYYLPTNAIPPELSNLDALQGWLNNLYAGKAAFDGHVTDGTHTNVTLAGTVTIGGVARTDWPEGGTPGAITNNQPDATVINLNATSIIASDNGTFALAQTSYSGGAVAGLRLSDNAAIGWSSGGFWWQEEDTVLNRSRAGVLGVGTARGNTSGSVLAGKFMMGSTVDAKNAHVFSDGTNLFFVNVNSVTNVAVTAPVGSPPYVPIIIGTTNELPIVANRTNGVLYVEIP